jgi:hypothetical protein
LRSASSAWRSRCVGIELDHAHQLRPGAIDHGNPRPAGADDALGVGPAFGHRCGEGDRVRLLIAKRGRRGSWGSHDVGLEGQQRCRSQEKDATLHGGPSAGDSGPTR